MSLYELLDLAFSISARLDTHWSLFITVHLALIGGIIYVDRPLTKNEKIGAILIYTGFAIVNYFVMNNQVSLMASLYAQIASLKNDVCCTDSQVLNHVISLAENQYSGKMRIFVLLTHVAMFLVVLLSILYDKSKQESTD